MSTILRVKVQGLGRTFGLIEYSHLTSVIAQCLPTVLFGEGKKNTYILCITLSPRKETMPFMLKLQKNALWLLCYCHKCQKLQIRSLMKTPEFAELFVLIRAVSLPFSTTCFWKCFPISLQSCSSALLCSAGTWDCQVHFLQCNSPSPSMKSDPVW